MKEATTCRTIPMVHYSIPLSLSLSLLHHKYRCQMKSRLQMLSQQLWVILQTFDTRAHLYFTNLSLSPSHGHLVIVDQMSLMVHRSCPTEQIERYTQRS